MASAPASPATRCAHCSAPNLPPPSPPPWPLAQTTLMALDPDPRRRPWLECPRPSRPEPNQPSRRLCRRGRRGRDADQPRDQMYRGRPTVTEVGSPTGETSPTQRGIDSRGSAACRRKMRPLRQITAGGAGRCMSNNRCRQNRDDGSGLVGLWIVATALFHPGGWSQVPQREIQWLPDAPQPKWVAMDYLKARHRALD
jgi:hypothetical protein